MKNKLTKLLILFLALAFCSGAAKAYTLTQSELQDAVKSQIKKQTLKQLDNDKNTKIEIKIMNFPYGDVETINKPQIRVESNFDKFMYRDLKRVSVLDGQNFVRSFPVSVNILVYKDVLCATNPIMRSEALSASNTALERIEVGQYLSQTMSSLDNKQYIAMKNYTKGSPILTNYVRTKPDVIKDSMVSIIFSSDENLKIRLDGKALKEGSIGDSILVKSLKYNKIYSATVSNKNEVTVRI